ncbi:MAG: hypothetical protein FJ197_01915 [Gammaproteobacteria bacterium]|nr:hypothetical protein [Gammaproteobacteria bacterium]
MIQEHGLKDFRAAKTKAGERLGLEDSGALPSNEEVAAAMSERNRIFRGDEHDVLIRELRNAALRMMRELHQFDAKLVGPVLAGSASDWSSIDLHAFSDSAEAVGAVLDGLGLANRPWVHRLRTRRDTADLYPGYRFSDGEFDFTVTVFPERGRGNAPLSTIDGRPERRATTKDVEALVAGDPST